MIRTHSKIALRFSDYDLADLTKPSVKKYISSQYNDEIFPPYIPFIGKLYTSTLAQILIYATAQNINNTDAEIIYNNTDGEKPLLEDRLYWDWDFKKDYREDNSDFKYTDIAIQPFQDGILPALFGVFQYAWALRGGFEKFNTIMDHVAVSNYYKFSLRSEKTDLNPDSNDAISLLPDTYYKLNNNLVTEEIKCLNPDAIFTFNGYKKQNHLKHLFPNNFRIFVINDPSWIKYGHYGYLNQNGRWSIRVNENIPKNDYIRGLVDNYCDQIKSNPISGKFWSTRIDCIKIYLLKYFVDWRQLSKKINPDSTRIPE